MSRRIVTATLAGVAPVLILYAAMAFGYWQANPGDWDKPDRVFIAVLALLLSPFCAIAAATFPGDRT